MRLTDRCAVVPSDAAEHNRFTVAELATITFTDRILRIHECGPRLPPGDTFVRVAEEDKRGTDIAFNPFDTVHVGVEPNTDGLSASEWVAAGKLGGTLTRQPLR